MQQMPEEGRLFLVVDRNWKDVMKHTTRDPKVSCHLIQHKYRLIANKNIILAEAI